MAVRSRCYQFLSRISPCGNPNSFEVGTLTQNLHLILFGNCHLELSLLGTSDLYFWNLSLSNPSLGTLDRTFVETFTWNFCSTFICDLVLRHPTFIRSFYVEPFSATFIRNFVLILTTKPCTFIWNLPLKSNLFTGALNSNLQPKLSLKFPMGTLRNLLSRL